MPTNPPTPPAPAVCNCWLGQSGATCGDSRVREACPVHGKATPPAPGLLSEAEIDAIEVRASKGPADGWRDGRDMRTLCRTVRALMAERDGLRRALSDLLEHVTAEPNGRMSGMANQEKRMQWYEKLMPLREAAAAALAAPAPAAKAEVEP